MNKDYVIDKQKIKKFLFSLLGISVVLFAIYKSFYYLTPFIIALILSFLMEPAVKLMMNKLNLSRKLASAVSLIVVLLALGFMISLLISRLIVEIKGVLLILPSVVNDLYKNITELSSSSSNLIIGLPEDLTKHLGNLLATLLSYFGGFLNSIGKGLVNTAFSLPAVLVFILITILSTYFLSSDREALCNIFKSQLPENWVDKITHIKRDVFSSVFKLLRAYLIIMSITFTELLIGFSFIGIKYALVLAAIVCVIDILPVLGTGTVLIPWAIYETITNNPKMGIALFILYIVILIVRQIIEPKIIGHQIGVHPLFTLMAMYVGLKLLGAAGLILGPITMLVLKSIFSSLYKGKNLKDLLFKPIS